MLFAWIDEIQKMNGITGDIFEIGCHHGKSTILLGAMIEHEKEKLCVCDLFDKQDDNISISGGGSLEIFKRNIFMAFQGRIDIRIFQKNSKAINSKEIGNNFRFFHIDGGHMAEEALSDLRLAANSIIDKGVIALDDPFRPDWPGVTEALVIFLDEYKEFRAIIIGFNKLILVRHEYSDTYLREIQDSKQLQSYELDYPWQVKVLPFKGFPLQIYYMPTGLSEKKVNVIVRKYYRRHSWMKGPLFCPFIAAAKAIVQKI